MAGDSVVTSPRGVTAPVTAPSVREGGRAPRPGDSVITSPMGSRRRSRRRTCGAEAGPTGPGAPRVRTQGGSRRLVTGSRPLITPATAARIRRGVASPRHGDHGATLKSASWSRRPRRDSDVGHGGHGAGHGGTGHDPGTRRLRRSCATRDASGSRRPRRSSDDGHGGHSAGHGGAVRRVAAFTIPSKA